MTLPRRIYRDGPHGPVIAGIEPAEGDRRQAPAENDRKAAPRQRAAKGRTTKKPPASKPEAGGE